MDTTAVDAPGLGAAFALGKRAGGSYGVARRGLFWLLTSVTVSLVLTACGGGGGGGGYTAPPVAPAPVPAPTVTITANPTTVAAQATTQLQWSSTNATTCMASNAWSGPQATSGAVQIVPPTALSTFALTCSGTGGSSSPQSVTVTVQLPIDPAAGSVADTTLLGTDANGNGIRDDVEEFITQHYTDPTQQSLMLNYAASATKMLLAKDQPAAIAAQQLVDRTSVCGQNNFGLSQYQVERVTVQAVLLNNATRLQIYFGNQQLLDGLSFPALSSVTCNLDGKPYNGTP
jgi:hypothetical protein